MSSLSLGISPCPNDTFIFDALIHGRIHGVPEISLHMADVEELNALAGNGALDVTKLSLAAMLHALPEYVMLHSGAALGRGCGPLVVSALPPDSDALREGRIAIPGKWTTANLLLSLHGGYTGPRLEMVFDQVMPALLRGEADLGVIIHEGRFTYQRHGLSLVLDLGDWWETTTAMPLPLGVIAAKRSLGEQTLQHINALVRKSLEHARQAPADSLAFIRAHAQEMEDNVMQRHIDMFVNDYSLDLKPEGRGAIRKLLEAGARTNNIQLPDVRLFI